MIRREDLEHDIRLLETILEAAKEHVLTTGEPAGSRAPLIQATEAILRERRDALRKRRAA